MENTKIETFTDSWNPVQGCLGGCRYCFASGIAKRFGGHRDLAYYMCQEGPFETGRLHVLDEPMRDEVTKESEPYPFGFDPTFCRFRLGDAAKIKRPGNIFVCSMGDLFGPWVPDRWIDEVMQAAMETPRHNYCFLTKFPERYNLLPAPPPNFLFGASIDTQKRMLDTLSARVQSLRFLSVEPMLERIDLERFIREAPRKPEWLIVGPENGKATGWVPVQRAWVEEILSVCKSHNIPLYIKYGTKTRNGRATMHELMGEAFSQRYHPLLLTKINKTPEAPEAHGKEAF